MLVTFILFFLERQLKYVFMLAKVCIPFFLLLFALIHAETIRSTTGNIILDIDNDGASEARVSVDGLSIGADLTPSANLHLQGNGIVTGDLVIGGTAGNSTLEVQGTLGYGFETVSSNTTLGENSLVFVDTSSDNITVTLPYAGNTFGRHFQIKKISQSNSISLVGGGSTIDGSDSYIFSSGNMAYIDLISDGSNWNIINISGSGIEAYTQTLYVYEGFNYAEGNLDTNNGGTGFADAWYASTSSGNSKAPHYVTSSGLSYSTLPVEGKSILRYHASNPENGRVQARRTIESSALSVLTQDNSTIWFSILYNAESGGYNTKFAFSSHPYIGINNDGGLLTESGNAFGFYANSGTMKAIVHDNNDASSVDSSSLSLSADTTYLIVGKIVWKANGTNDELYLYNVTDVNTEPTSAFSTRSADLDQSNFTWLAYWETSDSQIDEIRFGTTFDAVMGR